MSSKLHRLHAGCVMFHSDVQCEYLWYNFLIQVYWVHSCCRQSSSLYNFYFSSTIIKIEPHKSSRQFQSRLEKYIRVNFLCCQFNLIVIWFTLHYNTRARYDGRQVHEKNSISNSHQSYDEGDGAWKELIELRTFPNGNQFHFSIVDFTLLMLKRASKHRHW